MGRSGPIQTSSRDLSLAVLVHLSTSANEMQSCHPKLAMWQPAPRDATCESPAPPVVQGAALPVLISTKPEAVATRSLSCSTSPYRHYRNELLALSSRLEFLPLAMVQVAAFIQANSESVSKYVQLLDRSD